MIKEIEPEPMPMKDNRTWFEILRASESKNVLTNVLASFFCICPSRDLLLYKYL